MVDSTEQVIRHVCSPQCCFMHLPLSPCKKDPCRMVIDRASNMSKIQSMFVPDPHIYRTFDILDIFALHDLTWFIQFQYRSCPSRPACYTPVAAQQALVVLGHQLVIGSCKSYNRLGARHKEVILARGSKIFPEPQARNMMSNGHRPLIFRPLAVIPSTTGSSTRTTEPRAQHPRPVKPRLTGFSLVSIGQICTSMSRRKGKTAANRRLNSPSLP